MRCPKCHGQNEKVIDSRVIKDGAGVRRRRECLECGYRFSTYEEVINEDFKVIKRDLTREDFDRSKLCYGIERACWKRPISNEMIQTLCADIIRDITTDFDREVPTQEIGERIIKALRELDEVAYIRFASVYRKFKDATEFISEIQTLNEGKSEDSTC